VTETVAPLTSHPNANLELQLQRPVETATPASVRGRKNPMKKFMQQFRDRFYRTPFRPKRFLTNFIVVKCREKNPSKSSI
jgi:hypothetical protein